MDMNLLSLCSVPIAWLDGNFFAFGPIIMWNRLPLTRNDPFMDLSTKDVSVDSAYLIPELHLRSGTAGTKSSLHAPKMAVVGQQGHLCFLVQKIFQMRTNL